MAFLSHLTSLLLIPFIPGVPFSVGVVSDSLPFSFGETAYALFGWFLVLWSLAWKGLALWTAARARQKWWFFGFLFINTLGILEILYLFVFFKNTTPTRQQSAPVV